MKLQCKQCGATLAITSPDAFVCCPYCGAKAVVSGYTGANFLHRPVLDEKDVIRLYPSGSVASVSLYWFPFDSDTLNGVFTQPYTEMENYLPPSADRRVWDEATVQGKIIPVDPDLLGDSGVVYHPFWVAISASTFQGAMVDGVTGRKLGESAKSGKEHLLDPTKEALSAFLTGVVPTLIVFFLLLKVVSVFWASLFGMASAILVPVFWDKRIRKRSHE